MGLRVFFITLAALFTVFVVTFLIIQGYRVSRDVDSWIDRAQVAADRDDMLEYIKRLKENMEKWGMTEGYTALIFRKPINDLRLHYKAVKRYIQRLESIKEIPRNETAYQVALDDLRGTIRELPNPSMGWLWVNYIWWLSLICVVLWGVALVVYLLTEY
jgi:hypothetical protein